MAFKLTPPVAPATQWTETVIYSFTSQGYSPIGSLIFDTYGALYGTTSSGAPITSGARCSG
jgi:hypothetical protein